MKTVYIASPYTKGDKLGNTINSIMVADELLKLGFIPYVPLLTHFWDQVSPKPYSEWVKMDDVWVKKCDYLLRLPGESSGADHEVQLAIENGIPVFYSVEALAEECK